MNGHPVNQCASPDCAIYQYRANATGNTYDQAREREQGADTDTRQAFCAGMVEAYKDALAILSGAKEEA
jgi:hypothetical protein